MTKILATLTLALLAGGVAAQDEAPAVYQEAPKSSVNVIPDLLLRQEWNEPAALLVPESRRMIRLRPRVEASFKAFTFGVGGDFTQSSDDNDIPPPNVRALPLVRENYRSNDRRLDVAFARIEPASWIRLEGGRFFMPVPLTEMIWDRDLRPQGAAVTLKRSGTGPRLSLTGLVSQGGHVYDDGDTRMVIGAASVGFGAVGATVETELTAAYVTWSNYELEPILLRQNSKASGRLLNDYDVVDLIARLRHRGRVDVQLVLEGCRNLGADAERDGIWLAGILGAGRASAEYTYAFVKKDATLAAYAGDDFVWETGWEGHRLDVGVGLIKDLRVHAVGQKMRFEAAPNPADRNRWDERLRLELRWRGR